MELPFEIPRSGRPQLLFLAAIVLAIALGPALLHLMGLVSPALAPETTPGGAS